MMKLIDEVGDASLSGRRRQEASEGAELHLGPPALLPIASILPLRRHILSALLVVRLASIGEPRLEYRNDHIELVLV